MEAPNRRNPRLAVFDVEGVLVSRNRFIFDVGKSLGVSQLLKMFFIGFLYKLSVVKLKPALKRIFKIMRGVRIETVMRVFEEIPSRPMLESFFAQLKIRNCKIALISSGLPKVVVEKLASMVGADYAFGIEVGLNDEALTGEI